MKFFLISLVIALFGGSHQAAEPPCDGVTPTPAEDYTVCTDACKIALCDSTGKKVTDNACPSSALNCVAAADKTGTCSTTSTTSDSSCSVLTAAKFKCTAPLGKFPDPLDCRARYLCSKDITVAGTRVMCAANEFFSEATGLCVASTDPTKCITVDCKTKMGNGIYSPYGTSTKYYALCITDTTAVVPTTTITMYQCPTGAAFDKTVGVSKCVYKCTAAGKFAYSLDSKKYYNCVKGTGTTITPTLTACPDGTVFVAADKDCGFAAAANLGNSTTV